ncbi:beta-lactamase [Hypoxylon rubiginosum]|uniref:Beta-lactamase n=1 Tax=Hypoxylon rubiginosum TaxID=110542 RepID=A0ACB9YPM6_9PEZI|nr:beta-lactamase [Hypoxylon rubiginosum]
MSEFDKFLEESVHRDVIPGAVLYAQDKDGSLEWAYATSGPGVQYTMDTVMELASVTKLVTTIAALQLVERGDLSLDQNIEEIIPAFSSLDVLDGFDTDGTPLLHKRRNSITVEKLLTHTSGAAYPFVDARLTQLSKSEGNSSENSGNVDSSFDIPLSFEPGEGWLYGTGVDRLGQVIERVTKMSLEQYFHDQIFKPLGITTGTFWGKVGVPMSIRSRHGGMLTHDWDAPVFTGSNECHGGQGLIMSIPDFSKILRSLLVDDGILLKPESTANMFLPHLSPGPRTMLLQHVQDAEWTLGDIPITNEYSWGLGGLLVDGDSHPFRRRNTLTWGGAPSLYWFIDRAAGIYGVFGTQVMPLCDRKAMPVLKAFEEEVYRKAGKLEK